MYAYIHQQSLLWNLLCFSLYIWISISYLLSLMFSVDTRFMQEIHNKVMSVDYSDFKAEIKTVDSQESLMGGVLVMVNGSLSSESTGKRNFTQSFFLAPQEKGYFVLNDIFRYLDEPSLVSKPAVSLPNGLPEPPIAPYISEPGLFSKLSVNQTLL
jgi:hypothetical protein